MRANRLKNERNRQISMGTSIVQILFLKNIEFSKKKSSFVFIFLAWLSAKTIYFRIIYLCFSIPNDIRKYKNSSFLIPLEHSDFNEPSDSN